MTRTAHPKGKAALRVQETESPRAAKKPKAAARPAPASKSAKTKSAPVKGKAHGHKAQPVPVDDPIPMQRASRETSHGRHAVKPARDTSSKRGETNLALERMPAPVAPRHKDVAPKPVETASAVSAPAAKKSATADDFLRAAQGPPPAEVFSQGESHPDDDERLPVASVSANNVVAPAPARVSGFGAEGVAPAHRTVAQTMAARKRIPVMPVQTAPSTAEQARITEEAVQPMVIPAMYSRGGRIMMPAPLKGTHEILVHQNTMADSEGLDRIGDDDALNHMVATHMLMRMPETATLHVNDDLPQNRRYARPWTVRFAQDLAAAYSARFHQPLQVNSAVRTVAYQIRLMRTNGNAAPPEGATASPHLTGQAIDIGKRGMSSQQIAWMRAALGPLMKAGKIDVEEEFQQACFHISVYRSYAPSSAPKKSKVQVAQLKAPRNNDDTGPSDDSLM